MSRTSLNHQKNFASSAKHGILYVYNTTKTKADTKLENSNIITPIIINEIQCFDTKLPPNSRGQSISF